MAKLRRCPFCAKAADMRAVHKDGRTVFLVRCRGCGAIGSITDSEAAAASAWNTRHERKRYPQKHRPKDAVFALYRGDQYQYQASRKEIVEREGWKPGTFTFYLSPTWLERSKDRAHAVRLVEIKQNDN